jgi:hypothetical protein
LEAQLRGELDGADGRWANQIEELQQQIQAAAEKNGKSVAMGAEIAQELESLR